VSLERGIHSNFGCLSSQKLWLLNPFGAIVPIFLLGATQLSQTGVSVCLLIIKLFRDIVYFTKQSL